MADWPQYETYPGCNTARRQNGSASNAPTLPHQPLAFAPVACERGLVYRYVFLEGYIGTRQHVCTRAINGSFTTVHPMESCASPNRVCQQWRHPNSLLSGAAPEMVGHRTEFMKEVNWFKIRMQRSDVGRSNQNYAAEREIGELKSDGGTACWGWKCRPSCGITAWSTSPTSWIGYHVASSSALELRWSLVRHQTSLSGLTSSSMTEFGTTTRSRSNLTAAGAASHIALVLHIELIATFLVTSYCPNLARLVLAQRCSMLCVTTISITILNVRLKGLIEQLKNNCLTETLFLARSMDFISNMSWPMCQATLRELRKIDMATPKA